MNLLKLNKNLLYLLTVLEAIEKIWIYTQSFSNAATFFEANNQKEFNATLNLLIAIGEESKKIDAELKHATSTLDWTAIATLRNELSHNYRGVDPDIIWDIVQYHLNPLKQACLELLPKVNPGTEILNKVLESRYYCNIQYLKN
ncbi:MAG: DUF86 domain-containing protein [Candidatus Margulisiibacteriota bacterium]